MAPVRLIGSSIELKYNKENFKWTLEIEWIWLHELDYSQVCLLAETNLNVFLFLSFDISDDDANAR